MSQSVTGPTAFWALLPVALSAMSQTSTYGSGVLGSGRLFEGSLVPHRSSPIICLVDAGLETVTLLSITWRAIRPKPLPASDETPPENNELLTKWFNANPEIIELAVKAKFRPPLGVGSRKKYIQSAVEDSRTTIAMKFVIFTLGVLPQAISIFGMQGIPLTQMCTAIYLYATVVRVLAWWQRGRFDDDFNRIRDWLNHRLWRTRVTFTSPELLGLVHFGLYSVVWQAIGNHIEIPKPAVSQKTSDILHIIPAVTVSLVLVWMIIVGILYGHSNTWKPSIPPSVIVWPLFVGLAQLSEWMSPKPRVEPETVADIIQCLWWRYIVEPYIFAGFAWLVIYALAALLVWCAAKLTATESTAEEADASPPSAIALAHQSPQTDESLRLSDEDRKDLLDSLQPHVDAIQRHSGPYSELNFLYSLDQLFRHSHSRFSSSIASALRHSDVAGNRSRPTLSRVASLLHEVILYALRICGLVAAFLFFAFMTWLSPITLFEFVWIMYRSLKPERKWIAFGMFNLLTGVLVYFLVFDGEGTLSPGWLAILGS